MTSGPLCGQAIDIESLQNRLLKVCYMPATSTGLPRLLFLLLPLRVLMKQTRQVVHAIKQSILLRCLWVRHTYQNNKFVRGFEKTIPKTFVKKIIKQAPGVFFVIIDEFVMVGKQQIAKVKKNFKKTMTLLNNYCN